MSMLNKLITLAKATFLLSICLTIFAHNKKQVCTKCTFELFGASNLTIVNTLYENEDGTVANTIVGPGDLTKNETLQTNVSAFIEKLESLGYNCEKLIKINPNYSTKKEK